MCFIIPPKGYQTGYLTITDYDKKFRSCRLGFTNNEVKYAFLSSLTTYYLYDDAPGSPFDVRNFGNDIMIGNLESLQNRFTALFARLTYPSNNKPVEQNFQIAVYLVFMLLGEFVHTEVHSAKGRADVIVETDDHIYIFEFKLDKSAEEAVQQIEDKGYATPYEADTRKLYKIGVNVNSETRELDGWKVVER